MKTKLLSYGFYSIIPIGPNGGGGGGPYNWLTPTK